MKKIMLSVLLIMVALANWAQDEEQEKGFKKQNLFTGGSITLSFYSGGAILGANPIFGYKLTNWLDGGIALNYTYQGNRDIYIVNDKTRQHVFGPGAFTRIFPIPFLFLQGQFEHNFNKWTYTYPDGTQIHDNTDANSFLVGGGWAQGRQRGSNTFFYLVLLFDVLKNPSSPYVNNVYDPGTNSIIRTDALPIFRAGVNIALFQGKNNNRNNEEPGNGRRQPHTYQGF